MSRAKDEFLAQVVQEKDAFLNQVIQDKEAFLNQVIQAKDAYWEKAVRAKDDRILEQDVQIEYYRNLFPLRAYRGLKRLVGKS